MAKRDNIVSFDDARNASRRGARARSDQDARSSRRATAERRSSGRATKAARETEGRSRSNASATRSSRAVPSWYEEMASSGRRGSRVEAFEEARWENGSSRDARRERGAEWDSVEENGRGSRSGARRKGAKHSAQSDKRRSRTKARADRMFSKQYAADSGASEPGEGAPRAALYEGKMGTTHRKSARMQRASEATVPSAKVNPAGWFSSLPITARSIKVATAALCVFLFCAFLYVPAQQYYQAQRQHEKLVVEYSTLEDRNTALDEQNEILASDAGMEDAVRQKYGYVKSGEEVAYVAGLSDEASAERRDSDELQANVLSSTVKAPEEWYTPLLDAFFGVE